jgi:drug/metabolite transporter (DMT)-like permease
MLVFSGVANAIGQYLWTRALVLAPATAVSPFYYFLLVWAMVIGFAVWGDVPTIGLLIGSGIVVASGLFLLWHEAQRKRATPAVAKDAAQDNAAAKLPAFSIHPTRR